MAAAAAPRPIRLALLVPGIALAAISLLGFFGEWFWPFDLLASFRLQYFVALAVLAAGLVLAGERRWALALGAVAMANGALILPLYVGSPAPPAGDERLQIVSFNIQLSHPRRQLGWIMEDDPDLVLLFESSRLAEEALTDLVDGYVVLSGIRADRNYGLTVLARQDLVDAGLVLVNVANPGSEDSVRLNVPFGDGSISVFGIHPPSPSNPFRTPHRDQFLERAGRAVADVEGPVVVVGDFNATPWSHGFRLLSNTSGLKNSQVGFGYGGTWPASLPALLRIPLDHLLHSDHLTTVSREVGPELSSDHLPIRVTLARSE